MKIRILIENKKLKNLLKEIKIEDAKASIFSRNTKKVIYNSMYPWYGYDVQFIRNTDTGEREPTLVPVKNPNVEAEVQNKVESLCQKIMVDAYNIRDIQEEEKAMSAIWIKNRLLELFKKDQERMNRDHPHSSRPNSVMFLVENAVFEGDVIFNFGSGRRYNFGKDVLIALERFFQYKDYVVPEFKDINRIDNFAALFFIVSDAVKIGKEDHDKKSLAKLEKDAEAGTENLGSFVVESTKEQYDVYVAHNKGAACYLGKKTHWCTAAPGLDFFKRYYSPDNPLFIFINKDKPEDKYQLHFGSNQFKDIEDRNIDRNHGSHLLSGLLSLDSFNKKYFRLVTDYPTFIYNYRV